YSLLFYIILRLPPISTLFPYTTLFRSNPFDRHIRDKMKNFTPDVSAGLWDKIKAGLARQTPDRAAISVRRRTVPVAWRWAAAARSEEHTSELQSRENLVCRLLLEKKKR